MDSPVVFGIDVSSRKSNVCEMIGQENLIKSYEISNDQVGFNILLKNLTMFTQTPQIIFEATGVYSERLQSFLDVHHFDYCRLNPLKAKQQLMRFRINKTDKHDAYSLANSQYLFHRRPDFKISPIYKRLTAFSRYYDQLTHDLVTSKNRLHRVLQDYNLLIYQRLRRFFPHFFRKFYNSANLSIIKVSFLALYSSIK